MTDWIGEKTKLTGNRPPIEKYDETNKQKVLDIARSRQLQESSLVFLTKIYIQEEVNNYFRKNMMTKDNFYKSIENDLQIREEKGRSRQRGIYKFYCMIGYELTIMEDKSRGFGRHFSRFARPSKCDDCYCCHKKPENPRREIYSGFVNKIYPISPCH